MPCLIRALTRTSIKNNEKKNKQKSKQKHKALFAAKTQHINLKAPSTNVK